MIGLKLSWLEDFLALAASGTFRARLMSGI